MDDKWTRLLLLKLYQILEKSDPNNEELHQLHQSIVREGHEEFYDTLFEELRPDIDKIPSEITSCVKDVTKMYVHLSNSYKLLNEEDFQYITSRYSYAYFIGFNKSNDIEWIYQDFAEFFLLENGAYADELNLQLFREMRYKPNSLKHYMHMLKIYEQYKGKMLLSKADIEHILSAAEEKLLYEKR